MTVHAIRVFSPTLQRARLLHGARTLAWQFRRTGYLAQPFERHALSLPAERLFRVRGTLLVDPDIPVARVLYLYSEHDHMLAGRTLSSPVTGAFEFPYLFGHFTYMVAAVDHTGEHRAETHDGQIPEPMA